MPGLFEFEYGDLDTGGTSVWDSWEQGSLSSDWEYQDVGASVEFDQFGIPQIDENYSGFQQFMPDNIAFSDTEGYGNYGDFDYGGYSSEVDALSGLSQDDLAYELGLMGFEYLLEDTDDNPDTPTQFELISQATGISSIDELAQIFSEQYGSAFGAYDPTGLNLQGDISEQQASGYYSAYDTWEEGAIEELELGLDQLGQDYLTQSWNEKREYLENMRLMNASQSDYTRSQILATKELASRGGRSGLSGGSMGKAADSLRSSISNQLQNLQSQKSRTSQAYSSGVESAEELYQQAGEGLVSGFQLSQSTQIGNLQDQIEGLESQFELDAGQSIGDWYTALITQVSNLDILGPDISEFVEGGDDFDFNWSPFGLDLISPGDEGDG